MNIIKKLTFAKHLFSVVVIIATIAAILGDVKPVSAGATITVSQIADTIASGDGCSLREAIIATNTNNAFYECPAGSSDSMDTINLQTGWYMLKITSGDGENNGYTGDLDITDSLTITGVSNESTWVTRSSGSDANNFAHRLFHVRAGPNEVVNIANLKLLRGNALNPAESVSGGGILNEGGSILNVYGVVFESNVAVGTGGGIANSKGSRLNVNASTFLYNQAEFGGGVWNQGTAVITNSYFGENTAKTDGGGFYNNAVSNTGESATLTNLTIVGNKATGNVEISGGGGVSSDGPIHMRNLTLHNNQEYGILMKGVGSIANSIIANSHLVNCFYLEEGTTFQSYGGNLESPDTNTCTNFDITPNGSLFRSGTPGYNGGITKTLELADDSIAIDHGKNEHCPGTDQRMLPRRWNFATGSRENGVCDIGAVEMGASYSDGVFLPVITR